MTLETVSRQKCFGGWQGFCSHASECTGTAMRFAVFTPPQAESGPVPVLYYLSGLTCTEETATIKAGAQSLAAEAGLMLVMPDTSPRGAGIEGEDDDWDFGTAAGFYLDATASPWSSASSTTMPVWLSRTAIRSSRIARPTTLKCVASRKANAHSSLFAITTATPPFTTP